MEGQTLSTRKKEDLDNAGQDDLRRPLVEDTETAPGCGLSAPRIRMAAIVDLKEFSGKDRDKERSRSWISKVKSAFLRDQPLDQEKCPVFEDLLTGPAQS